MSGGNPFVGLRPYTSAESAIFFGRREQTVDLLELLHHHRFIGVVGSSGCGKSSLVRAGMIAKLRAGMLVDDRDRWVVASMKPGAHPRQHLAAAWLEALPGTELPAPGELDDAVRTQGASAILETLAPALADANGLLLVDQFEEIFRYGESRDEASDFVSLMLALAEQRTLPIYVVMTMRSDFLGDCDRFRGLPEALNRGQYLVPRLTRRQRREAIEAPVRLFGREIAPRLVDRLLNEVGDQSDQLPVLQHTLMRLWERGEATLDVEGYEAIGTIEEALSRHAEEALDGMSEPELELTEKIFRALTMKDAENRRIRRPVALGRLVEETGAGRGEIRDVLERFQGHGRSFLVPPAKVPLDDDTVVDISHESLIRQWKRLSRWVDEEVEDGEAFRRLADAARRHADGKGDLLVGKDLASAFEVRYSLRALESWSERYGGGFSDAMRFLETSRREEKKRRLGRQLSMAMAPVLLAVSILGGLAFWQWTKARKQAVEVQERAYEANYYLAKVFEEKANAALDADPARPQQAWLYTLAALDQDIDDEDRLPDSQDRLPIVGVEAFRELWHSPIPPGPIQSVAFSPDGSRLASGSRDHSVRLWDVSTGESVLTLSGHADSVLSVAFSPDGNRLASGSRDHSVRLWDVSTGESVLTLSGHVDSVLSVAFSPDGSRLASGSRDHSVRLWDVSTGESVMTLSGHAANVWSLAFSPDGSRLASGSRDHSVRLWDVSTGESVLTLSGHADDVLSLAFSPDGSRFASGSRDHSVRLWDMSTGESILTLRGHADSVLSLAFSPDGSRLASGSSDNSVRLWNVSTGESVLTLSGHTYDVLSLAFTPNGRRLASGSRDNSVRLWDVSTGGSVTTLSGHADSVWSLAFSPDGTRFASGSRDNSVRLWDVSTGESVLTLSGHADSVWSLAFSPDGTRLASGSSDHSVRLWDVSAGERVRTLSGHVASVLSVAFSPDGSCLASGSSDHGVRLWDVSTGESVRTLSGHAASVLSVAFSPDGSRLASGSSDNSVRLWNVSTGESVLTLSGHTYDVLSVVFSPDGSRLASGSSDHSVRLWDVSTGESVNTLWGHEDVWSVAFSPDGSRLASGSSDNDVRLWDVSTGESVNTLCGHAAAVWSVAFSPDGSRLASGSLDHSVRLWDVLTGESVMMLSGHTSAVLSVAFSPDGSRLASGSSDHSVRLWDVSTGETVMILSGHADAVRNVAFSPDGSRLASGSADRKVRVWNLRFLDHFDTKSLKSPKFEKIYRASFEWMPYRLDEGRLVPEPRRLYLTPLNGYEFPKKRKNWKLDRPRPVDQDPIEWLLESVE